MKRSLLNCSVCTCCGRLIPRKASKARTCSIKCTHTAANARVATRKRDRTRAEAQHAQVGRGDAQ